MSGFHAPVWVGGSATGWEVADYKTVAGQTRPAAGGVAQLDLDALPDDQRWLIDHAVTSCTSSTPTDLRWYDGAVAALYVIEQTDSGNLDVADWPSGLQRSPSAPLSLVWSGCSDGAVGTLNAQVRVLRRRAS